MLVLFITKPYDQQNASFMLKYESLWKSNIKTELHCYAGYHIWYGSSQRHFYICACTNRWSWCHRPLCFCMRLSWAWHWHKKETATRKPIQTYLLIVCTRQKESDNLFEMPNLQCFLFLCPCCARWSLVKNTSTSQQQSVSTPFNILLEWVW